MLTKEELIREAKELSYNTESARSLDVQLDDGYYITEEEVRSYLKDMAHEKGADSDYSQGFADAVGTAVRSLFDTSPSDLIDDSEEGEGDGELECRFNEGDTVIGSDGKLAAVESVNTDIGANKPTINVTYDHGTTSVWHALSVDAFIDPTKPLRVRVADEMQARELSNMAIDAGFSVKGHYCDKNQLLVRPEEESSMWMDKRRENPADFVTDFSDRKPQVEAYLDFHSEEGTDMTDGELTHEPCQGDHPEDSENECAFCGWLVAGWNDPCPEHPDREDDDSKEREIAEGEGVCEWTENEDGDWETGCDFVLPGDTHFPREPNENYCQNCGGEIEIVEEGEADYAVGDVVLVGWDHWDEERYEHVFVEGVENDDGPPFIYGPSTKGGVGVNLNPIKEKVGTFQPNDEFFERVPEECNGSLVIDDHAGVLFDTMCRKHDFPYDCRQAVIGPEGDRYSVAGAKATGIVLSVSELESVFCKE